MHEVVHLHMPPLPIECFLPSDWFHCVYSFFFTFCIFFSPTILQYGYVLRISCYFCGCKKKLDELNEYSKYLVFFKGK